MSQLLKIENFGAINVTETTALTAAVAPGSAVSVSVKNTQGLTGGDVFALGTPGNEQCELVTITSITNGTAFVATSVSFTHQPGEPVTDLFGSQIKVYSAANVNNEQPADAAFANIGSPVTIEADQLFSYFTDPSGGINYWYKYTYLNPTTNNETDLGSSLAVRGGNYGNYASVENIRFEAGFANNTNITDSTIDRFRQRAERIIDGYLFEDCVTPFQVPIPPLIEECATLLAAGYLMISEYGESATGTDKDGKALIAQVMDEGKGVPGILDLIKLREVTLLDPAGNSLMLTQLVSSYPDNNTTSANLTDAQTDGVGRMFSSGMKF